MDLLSRTYELVGRSTLSRQAIADGAGVDVNWFDKFKQRRIASPGVEKVQAVHNFLARKAKKRAA